MRPDGSLVGYGAGGIDLLASMRLTRPVGRILALIPARTLDAAYHSLARKRSQLGRFVPDGPGPRRPSTR